MRHSYLKRITSIFLAVLLWGCQEQNSEDPAYGRSTFLPITDLTSEEDFQDYLLDYGIDLFRGKVIAHQGQLIITSPGGRLLSVSMDGDVNWSLARSGSGPGEFDYPQDMQIADDLIGILNIERARVSLYTIDGQFYKDVQLYSTPHQFGMAGGEIHIFQPFGTETLFAAYDIETEEVRRYGEKELIEVLPDQVTPENFMQYSNLLRADERYTVLGLVYHALLLIYDREMDHGLLMDLSQEKEIIDSMQMHLEEERKSPPGSIVTYHFLDLVKIGNYFGVMVPGPWDMEYALMYRISPTGHIHDKVYRPSSESRLSQMKNLTLLDDGTYFGHISSQDRLVIVSLVEEPGSFR